jgi:hypothetical protein
MTMTRLAFRVIKAASLACLLIPLHGQTQLGQIVGRVTDASNAVIPDATIAASYPLTSATFTTRSNGEGYYVLSNLQYGRYTVSVSKAGFASSQVDSVEVASSTATTLNVRLVVSSTSTRLEVNSAPVLLQTQETSVAVNVDDKLMKDAPIPVSGNARTPSQYMLLSPTVQYVNGNTTGAGGGRMWEMTVTLDGLPTDVDASQQTNGMSYEPSVESIGEYTMIVNSAPAEYGRQGGAVLSYATKSGTNRLHGSLWDYLQNSDLNARQWQAAKRPIGHNNEFGVALGGPVFIPKIYDGRNKTFFYTTVAGYRASSAGTPTSFLTTLTPAERQGNFAGAGVPQIYDPNTEIPDASGQIHHAPFANNQIPISRLSAVSANLLPFLPQPNQPGNPQLLNFVGVTSNVYTPWNITIKGDEYLTQNNRLSAFYNRFTPSTYSTSYLGPQFGTTSQTTSQRVSVSDAYTITPSLVNTLSIGVARQSGGLIENNFGQDFGSKLGLRGYPDGNCPDIIIDPGNAAGNLNVCNGGSGNQQPPFNLYGRTVGTLDETLMWNKGRHTFKFGYQYIQWRIVNNTDGGLGGNGAPASGVFQFSQSSTADTTGVGGLALASFFLGDASSVSVAAPLDLGYRESYHALFAQDDWKVTPTFTVNAGLRYDVAVPYSERFGQLAVFDPSLPNPGATGEKGAMAYLGNGPGRTGTTRAGKIWWNSLAPRLGLAWQFAPKTVFRAFAGIIYQGITNPNIDAANHTGFQASGSPLINPDPYGVYFNWDTPFPQSVLGTIPNTDPAFRNGQSVAYMDPGEVGRPVTDYMISAGFQRELPGHILLDASYLSNLRRHDSDITNLNALNPKYWSLGPLLNMPLNSPQVQAAGFKAPYPEFSASLPLYRALLPYPQFNQILNDAAARSSSDYHAALIKAEKRYSNGLTLLAHWTISKQITDTDWGAGNRGVLQRDPYNLRLGKALDRYDTPSRIVLSYSYELPFGPGKKFVNHNVVGKYVLGGWTFAGIHNYQAGSPLNITGGQSIGIPTITTASNRTLNVPVRNSISCSDLQFGNPARDHMLNAGNAAEAAATGLPLAFYPEGDYQIGNTPTFDPHARQCWTLNENFSLVKRFPLIGEHTQLVLGADAINAFNRHQFQTGVQGVSTTSATFGLIQPYQPFGPRVVQVRMRVDW